MTDRRGAFRGQRPLQEQGSLVELLVQIRPSVSNDIGGRAMLDAALGQAQEIREHLAAIIVQVYPDHPSHDGGWEKWKALDEIERLTDAALSALSGGTPTKEADDAH